MTPDSFSADRQIGGDPFVRVACDKLSEDLQFTTRQAKAIAMRFSLGRK